MARFSRTELRREPIDLTAMVRRVAADLQQSALDRKVEFVIAAGITEYRCANCDGAGEWDEGPLPATSSAQISPDYRHMVCSDCEGKGTVALPSTEGGSK